MRGRKRGQSGEGFLTSCLYAKVDLGLRGMGDGVATKIHIHTDEKQERESKHVIIINVFLKMGGVFATHPSWLTENKTTVNKQE